MTGEIRVADLDLSLKEPLKEFGMTRDRNADIVQGVAAT